MRKDTWIKVGLIIVAALLTQCKTETETSEQTLFSLVTAEESGFSFTNQLTFDNAFNIYTYRNYYNGGGVALGDVNNDGLLDIYMTANMTPNRLFLNKGNFTFEDVTEKAGVAGTRAWSTGVSMADVNGDGWLDIYVCNSGDINGDNKQNELFINNGDLTFTDRAAEYNLADPGYTTHAAFFDFDRDGDLDVYILNNSYQAIGSFNLRKNERNKRDSLGGDKLMRNDGGIFTDVSVAANIYGSVIGFGLGVTVGDFNKDNWPDIFVSNDFFERDYLYVNNGDGTFQERLENEMKSISAASMGADAADINNDGLPDLFVTEMLPEQNDRIKTITTFEDWNRYRYNLENNYYHQFTRNILQVNNGDSTFSEISRFAGVEATDWSWGALIFDMDNDGLKDIFVANGIYQDLTNQDFLQFASNEEFVKSVTSKNMVDYQKLTEIIPSNPVANYAFHNQSQNGFVNKATDWGLGTPGFSNGSAYGDLDNDGDLDLVVNNVNMASFLYRNNANTVFPENHFLKFVLVGEGENPYAVGASVTVQHDDRIFYVEQMPIRGFQSTIDPRPNIGVGNTPYVDRVTIRWPNGKVTTMDSVKTNQVVTVRQADASEEDTPATTGSGSRRLFRQREKMGIDFRHQENLFVDFDRDRLIYHMISTEGPRMSQGDVNGDGLDDFFIGGAKDQPGALYVQRTNGTFMRSNEALWQGDKRSEDMGSTFFDADGDGDLDLYVCSGGVEISNSSPDLIDRLYINDGKGRFTRSSQTLPTAAFESSSCVAAGDFDADGDQDLFVGIRSRPFFYGLPMNGYVLQNDGKGNFTEVTSRVAPALKNIGMITDAVWADLDGDGDPDLVVVGEYMPVRVLLNDNGLLTDRTAEWKMDKSNGWWNRIEVADVDNDGDPDLIVGNHGLNSRFRASAEKPVCLYVNDFDRNGTVEQIVCTYSGDQSYPMVLRQDLVTQIPSLKKKYLKFENYKQQTITDIFSAEQLDKVVKLDAYELRTSLLLNHGDHFSSVPLPKEAQYAPVYGLLAEDFDGDGFVDLVVGGNLYGVKPEAGRYDASYGLFLKGDGKGGFRAHPASASGIRIDGEVRDFAYLKTTGGKLLVVGRNNEDVLVYEKNIRGDLP